MIKIEALVKKYGKFYALNGIDLEFTRGQIIALVGPNASGKTSLIKCILGMVVPTGGTIEFDGKSISGQVLYKEKIGYMPQIGRYPDHMSMGYLFRMMKDLGTKRVTGTFDEELIESFRLGTAFSKSMRSLSGGTRQKVSAALAFLFNPDVIILDEPTAGLDPIASEILKEKIRKSKAEGKLVVVTSHILSEIEEIANRIAYLADGRIVFNKTIEEIREDSGETRLGKAIFKLFH
jgi:Cu-processing system ATP-binding protein